MLDCISCQLLINEHCFLSTHIALKIVQIIINTTFDSYHVLLNNDYQNISLFKYTRIKILVIIIKWMLILQNAYYMVKISFHIILLLNIDHLCT